MSKKNFSGGLGSLLGEQPEQKEQGGGKPSTRIITKSSQKGTREGETRATFVVNEELLEKVKAIAYWDRISIKEVLNRALLDAVALYEQEHGAVKPIPKK
jgi:hypothetical protein